jgi:D-xylose transport system substrate-binding protein
MSNRLGAGTIGTLVLVGGMLACFGSAPANADGIKLALLLPCPKCADRFEQKDRPYFVDAVAGIDPSVQVIVSDAEGDTGRQLAQAEAALAQGVKVLVVIPIEDTAAAPIVDMAHREKVPVLAYDGMIRGALPDAYVSFDNQRVGELQARYVVDHVAQGGRVALINGDQVCEPCKAFKRGAHDVLDPLVATGRIKLVYEADTKNWLAANAQREVEQALTATNDEIDAIVAANDTLAQGAIAALRGRRLAGKVIVTGQDASDAAIRHILAGEQTMTVYKALRLQAAAAAKAAVLLAKGGDIALLFPVRVANDKGEVPSLLLTPVAVDRSNIAETVIKDGYTRREDVCQGAVAENCDF